ncbi:hematopoietic SH2 domain-containing protein homolog isoform X2 [Lampris incognitus]|nr:hematopoietic SH2 domain-containing protein homolog isoform X2 [Lampris incognitus]
MIDVLQNGRYVIVGESAHHQSLQDLVDFHRRTPIMPFKEVLTFPCGQISKDKADYAELLLPHNQPMSPHTNPLLNSSLNNLKAQENVVPALPHRSTTPRDSQISLPNMTQHTAACKGQASTPLYPCLEDELSHFSSQIQATVEAVKPVPLPRRKLIAHIPQPDQPPELPARSFLFLQKNEACTRTSSASGTVCNIEQLVTQSTGWEDGHSHNTKSQSGGNPDVKPSVVSSLLTFKRKFQKRRSTSQEHLSVEIHEEAEERLKGQARVTAGDREGNTEHEYQKVPWEQTVGVEPISCTGTTMGLTKKVLPQEYLPPPPFAPGY